MNIPEELIDQLSNEIFEELLEKSKKDGKPMTFDDIEKAVLLFRQRVGEKLMQNVVEKQEETTSKKKLSKMHNQGVQEGN